MTKHCSTQHQSKKVKTSIGFGRWEDNSTSDKPIINKCTICEYTSKDKHKVRRHMDKKHFTEKAPKLEKCDKCDYTSTRTNEHFIVNPFRRIM